MIDSHAHLTASSIENVEEILRRAQEKKMTAIINICTDSRSLEKGFELAQRYPWIYNAAATTPHDVEKEGEVFFPIVEEKVKQLVAIGETGLDYHYQHSSPESQKKYLLRYLELARKSQLPIIFHCRDAFQDLFELSDAHYRDQSAVLHCFTGSKEESKKCLERGWFISFSGIVTFKKSEALREIAFYVPLDRILIETDTPYLAPQSKRGKQNEPSFVDEIARTLAVVKGISFEEVTLTTARNAIQFFKLPIRL